MDIKLRQLISATTDEMMSEHYTEPQIQARLEAWHAANPDADLALEAEHQLTETRDFSEELLYRVIARLLDAGYLNQPAN
ncbi:hypothetical protein [Lacticaseibacillus sp. GG6-2]